MDIDKFVAAARADERFKAWYRRWLLSKPTRRGHEAADVRNAFDAGWQQGEQAARAAPAEAESLAKRLRAFADTYRGIDDLGFCGLLEEAALMIVPHVAQVEAAPPPEGCRYVGFSCDGRRHQVICREAPTLTASGLDLKTAADVEGVYTLMQESETDSMADQPIGDGQAAVLATDGSSKFYAVPPTNNG